MATLQRLCIDVIVHKFDRYFSAICKSDDASDTKKFQFLQRKYSLEILLWLHDEDKLKEQYIDFLVNKYIKFLDADWFTACSWETVCSKLKEVGPYIQELYFCNDEVDVWYDNPWHEVMCYLYNLEVVTCNCANDEYLESIAKFCPNVMEIKATFSDITDKGVISLCMNKDRKVSCPKLKTLNISSPRVTGECVEYAVKYLPLLEEIDLKNLPNVLYSLHKNDISSLDKIKPYNLNTLNLLNLNQLPYFTDLLKICLFLCPCLKTLFCPVLQKDHLELFSDLTELEKLHLEIYSIENINDLFKLIGKKLRTLKVCYGSFSICSLAENFPYLKYLDLHQVTFQNIDKSMPEFHCLETCIFDSIQYNYEASKAISVLLTSSPKLEHIGFLKCDISSSELKNEILKCCKTKLVKKINFTGSSLEVDFVKDILLHCYSLNTINLENSNILDYDGWELADFAQSLPNNPKVFFSEDLSDSDDHMFEDDDDDMFEDDDDDMLEEDYDYYSNYSPDSVYFDEDNYLTGYYF